MKACDLTREGQRLETLRTHWLKILDDGQQTQATAEKAIRLIDVALEDFETDITIRPDKTPPSPQRVRANAPRRPSGSNPNHDDCHKPSPLRKSNAAEEPTVTPTSEA